MLRQLPEFLLQEIGIEGYRNGLMVPKYYRECYRFVWHCVSSVLTISLNWEGCKSPNRLWVKTPEAPVMALDDDFKNLR